MYTTRGMRRSSACSCLPLPLLLLFSLFSAATSTPTWPFTGQGVLPGKQVVVEVRTTCSRTDEARAQCATTCGQRWDGQGEGTAQGGIARGRHGPHSHAVGGKGGNARATKGRQHADTHARAD
jgi:hypothetical protein